MIGARMRRMTIAASSVLLAAASVGSPPARVLRPPPPEDILVSAGADPATCSIAVATRATVGQIVRGGPRMNGRCLKVSGFWRGEALYARSSGAPANGRSRTNAASTHVGLYVREWTVRTRSDPAGAHTIVGILGRCETEWPDMAIVLGYCEKNGGPILRVAEILPR